MGRISKKEPVLRMWMSTHLPPTFQRGRFPLAVGTEQILRRRVQEIPKGENWTTPPFLKKGARIWTKENSQLNLHPIQSILLGKKPWDRHQPCAAYARKDFVINLSFTFTGGHTRERGLSNARTVLGLSCSLQTSKSTSESTQARSPTPASSAPRRSPTTPPCGVTGGSTPRRSLTRVKTAGELSATKATSTSTDARTRG